MALRHVHIFILIYCMGDQERFQGAATGPYPSCPCYNRPCDFSRICSPTPNCSRENVALGKAASMSSYYSGSGPACLAVNGYTGTTYTGTDHRHIPTCIHTGEGDHYMWWAVELGQLYTVTDITVYIRSDEPQRMDNVRITVDGKYCYTFPPGTTGTPSMKSVSCNSPVQGSFVRLTRDVYNDYLNFCQVEIWVCKPGLYGRACNNHCNCKNNAVCDNYYGTCPAGCETGYYGLNCTQKCGNCKFNSACESTNGYCLDGCQTGWKEPMCKECISGYFGTNCDIQCGNCRDGMICNNITGVCPDGCEDGYRFPLCKQKCLPGTWGRNCKNTCGACLSQTCRPDNGNCENGCFSGYEGEQCTGHTDSSDSSDLTGVIVGSVFGAVVLLGIIIAVIIWCCRYQFLIV